MDDCIFCKIATGEIPSTPVFENDDVIAFDDLSPQAPVHTLVIPKAHYRNLSDDVPASVLAAVFSAVSEVARIKGVSVSGYRVIVNNGWDANQTVQHLHVHILGGRRMSHGMVLFAEEA
ncbi:MAG: histidine triad nucleotide-binding protein [Coriobacteriia bacterium]|nr:histidine triad nucleotide-binding protein [Coriobacteriia bacterium]